MHVIHSLAELRQHLAPAGRIGFVPTMGNLHQGHIDLTHVARSKADTTVVSIFVNRLQFGPNEDFDRYPRTLKDDCARCEAAGVDVVFAPDEAEMYPSPQVYTVDPGPIQELLEGAVRPGHFRGVATVVLKLFGMVQPGVAVFGRKDYQQCRVIAGLVDQFRLPIELVFAPTSRADDGLALSSRNGYLTPEERAEAPQLHAALQQIARGLLKGERDFKRLESEATTHLQSRNWQPDYFAIRRQSDLQEPAGTDHELVILAAARLGRTRLIDNLEVILPG